MKKHANLILIFFVTIIGFVSGVWGALVVEDLYPVESIYYNKLLEEQNKTDKNVVIFREGNKVLGDISPQIIQRSVVGIAKAKDVSADILDNYYLPQDIISHGFVLTDDGWIITLVANLEKEINSELVVLNEGKVYSFKEKIVDPSTGVLFLKIDTGSEKLIPIKIGSSENVKVLNDFVSVDLFGNTFKHSIASVNNFNNLIQSSESLSRRLIASGSGDIGAPIINSNAEVVGIIESEDEGVIKIIPINYFKSKISQVLKDKKLDRSYLGLNYIDLSEFSRNGEPIAGITQDRGALVFSSQIINAVASGSPAQKAKIKYKDIIVSVEGESLGVNKNLSEIIQEYKIGSEVELEVLRDGNILKLNVILDTIK